MSVRIADLLDQALDARISLIDSNHETGFRLLNGFSEGIPELSIDIYGQTLLIHSYADDPETSHSLVQSAVVHIQSRLKWLQAGIAKFRKGRTQVEKRGITVFGNQPDTRLREHTVWYSLDLNLNQDASFYLDTRNLRRWLIDHMRGMKVFNAFAYTGSLGIAALAGGARRVIQLDRTRRFLNIARKSLSLNGFPSIGHVLIQTDFFDQIGRFKRSGDLFDCVVIDPPFFSATSKGRVDQVNESSRLINKVRPLVRDGGTIIAINNSLFVSGREYCQTLEHLCRDGYLSILEFIPVPRDYAGFHQIGFPPTDPAPFNHSTKIAILGIKRK